MVNSYVNQNNKLTKISQVANVNFALRELCEKHSLTYDRVVKKNNKTEYYNKNELKAIIEIV